MKKEKVSKRTLIVRIPVPIDLYPDGKFYFDSRVVADAVKAALENQLRRKIL